MSTEASPSQRRSRFPTRLITSLGGAALCTAALTGCGTSEIAYAPIRVPDTAKYLGMSDNDGGRLSLGAGKSFLLHIADSEHVDCGSKREIDNPIPAGGDITDITTTYATAKEVRALPGGVVQVTCHGASDKDFPVERFPSHAPPGTVVIIPSPPASSR